jgi:hypothetical protein
MERHALAGQRCGETLVDAKRDIATRAPQVIDEHILGDTINQWTGGLQYIAATGRMLQYDIVVFARRYRLSHEGQVRCMLQYDNGNPCTAMRY